MKVSNLLTGLRLACAPLLGWALVADDPRALWIFLVAAATDLLDGLAARTISGRSRVGAILDPAADKALVLVSFVAGATRGIFPLWLVLMVVCRETVQLAAGAAMIATGRRRIEAGHFEPTRLGKYAAFAQVLTILTVLVRERGGALSGFAARYAPPWMVICAALTVIAAVQYTVLLGFHRGERRWPMKS